MIGRRVSDQRPSRKGQVAETLLKAKEKLVNATSEVTATSSRLNVRSVSCWFMSIICIHSNIKVCSLFLLLAGVNRVSLLLIYFLSSQSSLSVGSDLDLMDVPSPAYPLRRSWDANQEGVGIEVNGVFLGWLQQLDWSC